MDRETDSRPAGGQQRPQQGFRTLSAQSLEAQRRGSCWGRGLEGPAEPCCCSVYSRSQFWDHWRQSHEDFRGKLHCCGGVFHMSLPFIQGRTLLRAFVSHFLQILRIYCSNGPRGFRLNFMSIKYSIMKCGHIHVVQTLRCKYPSGSNRLYNWMQIKSMCNVSFIEGELRF